jgi:hypothetical protein
VEGKVFIWRGVNRYGGDMHRIIFLRLGSRKLHLLKLIGACIFFASALLFLHHVYRMSNTADVMLELARNSVQAEAAGYPGGVGVSDILGVLMEPAAQALIWLAVFIAGFVVYQAGNFIIPVEEDVRELQIRAQTASRKIGKRRKRKSK